MGNRVMEIEDHGTWISNFSVTIPGPKHVLDVILASLYNNTAAQVCVLCVCVIELYIQTCKMMICSMDFFMIDLDNLVA